MVVGWRFCYIFVTKYQQKPILYVGSWSERKNKQTEIRLKNTTDSR